MQESPKKFSDVVRKLLVDHDYTERKCVEEFGVGKSWKSDFVRGSTHCPSADLLQTIYEKITGETLFV